MNTVTKRPEPFTGGLHIDPQSLFFTWAKRHVDAALRVTFHGWYWSVQNLPGVHVGDVVLCLPAQQGAALFVRTEGELPPGILASRIEPVHSHPHTPAQIGTPVSSDTSTTASEPAHQCSCPGPHAERTPQTPPAATPAVHTHSRTSDTAGEAPGVHSISIELVLPPGLLQGCCSQGTGKSRVALRISIEGGE